MVVRRCTSTSIKRSAGRENGSSFQTSIKEKNNPIRPIAVHLYSLARSSISHPATFATTTAALAYASKVAPTILRDRSLVKNGVPNGVAVVGSLGCGGAGVLLGSFIR